MPYDTIRGAKEALPLDSIEGCLDVSVTLFSLAYKEFGVQRVKVSDFLFYFSRLFSCSLSQAGKVVEALTARKNKIVSLSKDLCFFVLSPQVVGGEERLRQEMGDAAFQAVLPRLRLAAMKMVGG